MNEKWRSRIRSVSMDTIFSSPASLVTTVVLAWFARELPWWLIILCAVLVAVPIYVIRVERRAKEQSRSRKRRDFFLGLLSTIPNGTENDKVWNSWLLETQAQLRGRGLKRDAGILCSLIDQATEDRKTVAENFIREKASPPLGCPNIW